MSIIDPENDISVAARRDRIAERVFLENVRDECGPQGWLPSKTKSRAEFAYECADAMEAARVKEPT